MSDEEFIKLLLSITGFFCEIVVLFYFVFNIGYRSVKYEGCLMTNIN